MATKIDKYFIVADTQQEFRTWEKCIHDANDDPIVACRNVEAKLKERNHD